MEAEMTGEGVGITVSAAGDAWFAGWRSSGFSISGMGVSSTGDGEDTDSAAGYGVAVEGKWKVATGDSEVGGREVAEAGVFPEGCNVAAGGLTEEDAECDLQPGKKTNSTMRIINNMGYFYLP